MVAGVHLAIMKPDLNWILRVWIVPPYRIVAENLVGDGTHEMPRPSGPVRTQKYRDELRFPCLEATQVSISNTTRI